MLAAQVHVHLLNHRQRIVAHELRHGQGIHAVGARATQASITGVVVMCFQHLALGIVHAADIKPNWVAGEGHEGIVCLGHLRQNWKLPQP